jgi:hypothetical protein
MFAPLSLDQLLTSESVSEKPVVKSTDTAKTLESFHAQQLAQLQGERATLPTLKTNLSTLQGRYNAAELDFASPSALSHVGTIKDLIASSKLEREIQALEEKIASIESGDKTADYFLRVGDILFSYTDAKDRIAGGELVHDETPSKKSRIPANSVYSYFSSEPAASNVVTMLPLRESTVRKKASAIDNTLGFKRDKALESYLHALDPDSAGTDSAVANSLTEDYGNCPACDTELLFNDTFLDCTNCGYRDFILVDSEKPSYKDPPREMSYYAYKKINHLNEWLAQFQAKETTEISAAVLDSIKAELRKERITDMSKVKPSKLKEIVKKLKLHRCYDHVAHILNRLNGVSAPVLSREVEEKLRYMFKEIQFSFVKHCPKKRSNFLSYSFVLYKFCELLELDEYLPCFPLLKSREKLYMQDKIWQKICEDMGWEFIRTV